jgi:hypothetical protein
MPPPGMAGVGDCFFGTSATIALVVMSIRFLNVSDTRVPKKLAARVVSPFASPSALLLL